MSKNFSGLFNGTSDARRPNSVIKTYSKQRIKEWAKKQMEGMSGKARAKFNTACVVFDESTGKYYYGRNGGINRDDFVKNPVLFGDSKHKGLLPKKQLCKNKIGNCAEVDAINNALNDGAKLSNLHMTTIHTTKTQFGNYKEACENCIHAFKGKVKQNYSGWKGDK